MQKNEKITKEVIHLGTQMAAKILDIKEPNISFLPDQKGANSDISAVFIPQTYTIAFHKTWLEEASEIEVLSCTFHEMRHAYQYEQERLMVSQKASESTERILKWKEERSMYQVPLIGKHAQAHYLNQEIEIDAVAFSSLVMKLMFGVQSSISLSVKPKVTTRMQEILASNPTIHRVANS